MRKNIIKLVAVFIVIIGGAIILIPNHTPECIVCGISIKILGAVEVILGITVFASANKISEGYTKQSLM